MVDQKIIYRFSIFENGHENGGGEMGFFELPEPCDGMVVGKRIHVSRFHRRKGIATKLFIMASRVFSGIAIYSDVPRMIQGVEYGRTTDGTALWESFVRKGYAKREGDNGYVWLC